MIEKPIYFFVMFYTCFVGDCDNAPHKIQIPYDSWEECRKVEKLITENPNQLWYTYKDIRRIDFGCTDESS